ncbi:hypothetical protein LF817_13205 [Halobacillus sp. A1]|uniref:hypothetical protein n=1 Tax=Halobacillus sp. A1 TaxID=2880262 RepID=UPI0020A67B48|nr:hypothetical protein [Halobacillus sp. A1]MCP3032299.1 hypothetical protein [Halobacillus sp. A1]
MNKVREGVIQILTSILAALLVSLYFYWQGSEEYALLVFLIAFIVFVGSGIIVKIMYLWIQWRNRYLTNFLVYMLSGAVLWVLIMYFPPIYSIIFEDFTVQRFLSSNSISGFLRNIAVGALCGLIFFNIYFGLTGLFAKVGNVMQRH